ncbi:MAG: response regulator transcription factor [Flavobacterium sp.]|uniref:winged helix-turn-helix domain-containing protein n=1 Tax=Flavobacterium sp. TaxID=239 RepID=UPI001216AFE3|nr:response regulator transcription factor [Flavobacterium sp.]RZJ66323.1 MAG: response regulator transcription factor [Flavobacterium sp.]
MPKSKRYLIATALSCFLLTIACAYVEHDEGEAWRLIALRNIGHHLLLQSGDSTSRVLPISKLSKTEYEIRFEKAFQYDADSLVKLISREVASGHLPTSYVVNVVDSKTKHQYYTFGQSEMGELWTPCVGRKNPVKLYSLQFVLADNSSDFPKLLYAGAIPIVLLLVGFRRNEKPAKNPVPDENNGSITIGNYRYKVNTQTLTLGPDTIVLTSKEAKVLEIFARHQNEIVARELLQKEVWENDGVIVGRSLDVFISKLRRKLDADARIRISSIHGKGYKLIVDESIIQA